MVLESHSQIICIWGGTSPLVVQLVYGVEDESSHGSDVL